MNTRNDKKASPTRFGPRMLVATALVVAVGAGGASLAYGGPGLPGHHGHGGEMVLDPAAMDAHIDKMVERLAADASPDQKARVAAIAKAALADLRPTHEQFRQAHGRAHELLMAPVIDRAALEQLRVTQMERMDFISRRILAAAEDAADVLTPEQRARFAAHLRARLH